MVLPHMGLTDPRAYMRLAAIVRQQIIDGKLRPGGPAPSMTFLSQEHGHARPTCSRALRILEGEGLLTRIPGLGYYVNHGRLAEAGPLGTADEYSNLSARHRPHATKAGSRPAATTTIDRHATRSHRGGHWFDPSIAHQVRGYFDLGHDHGGSHSCSQAVSESVRSRPWPAGAAGAQTASTSITQGSAATLRPPALPGPLAWRGQPQPRP